MYFCAQMWTCLQKIFTEKWETTQKKLKEKISWIFWINSTKKNISSSRSLYRTILYELFKYLTTSKNIYIKYIHDARYIWQWIKAKKCGWRLNFDFIIRKMWAIFKFHHKISTSIAHSIQEHIKNAFDLFDWSIISIIIAIKIN